MSRYWLVIFIMGLLLGGDVLYANDKAFASQEVTGYVTFALKDSTQIQEFEQAAKELIKVWNANVPGTRLQILKADRGSAKGSYIELLHFDTKARRDSYWPQQGKSSEKLKTIYKEHPEINEKMQKVSVYVSFTWHGDFVAIQ